MLAYFFRHVKTISDIESKWADLQIVLVAFSAWACRSTVLSFRFVFIFSGNNAIIWELRMVPFLTVSYPHRRSP